MKEPKRKFAVFNSNSGQWEAKEFAHKTVAGPKPKRPAQILKKHPEAVKPDPKDGKK